MVCIGDTELRVRSIAGLTGHHECRNAGDIGTIREYEQVVHDLDVLFKRFRNSGRNRSLSGLRRLWCGSGFLNSPFEFPNTIEIVTNCCSILRTDFLLKVGNLSLERIENTAVFLSSRRLAEHSFESSPWVDLDGQRRRWSAPGHRV